MSKTKRRQNYVDSKVQGRLVLRFLLHWGVFFVTTMMCVFVMQLLLGDPEEPLAKRMFEPTREYLILGIIMVTLLPAFTLDTIRFSNRFAGPVLRLRRALRELADNGTAAPLKFRNNDFWAEAAEEFNLVLNEHENLRRRVEELERNQSPKETANA